MTAYALMLQTDPDDEFFTRTTLEEMGLSDKFRFSNAESLEDGIAEFGKPVVVLLNDSTGFPAMAKLNSIKTGPYRHLPVVILGEHVTRDYKDAFYKAGAAAYISKPSSIADTRKKIEAFSRYWFEVAD